MSEDYQSKFIKIFDDLKYQYSNWELFQDFCSIAVWNIRRPLYSQSEDEIVERFTQYDKKYNQEVISKLSKAFSYVMLGLEERYHDFLGDVYMKMGLGKNQIGQFFTPSHISDFMSYVSAGNLQEQIDKEGGYITVNDPTCGAGSLLISFIKTAIEAGVNHSDSIYFVCQDLDELVANMCYIQLSLCGAAATIVHGNTLTMKVFSKWHTPVYFLNNWEYKLKGKCNEVYNEVSEVL